MPSSQLKNILHFVAGGPTSLPHNLKDRLRAAGWTILQAGVIYDRDPGDEHVEADRWAATSKVYQSLKAQSWVIIE